MPTIVGLDIGGANTKIVILKVADGRPYETSIECVYYPIWKKSDETLADLLKRATRKEQSIETVAVTITAELADAFAIKGDGVNYVLDSIENVFPKTSIQILDYNGNFRSVKEARANPITVSGANWPATGWLVAQKIPTCITIDIGSTSTSIIPIADGRVSANGRTDLEKLQVGELVYTGSLRTTVPAITQRILLGNISTRVSAEWFAQSGDVHRILGHISDSDYSVDTPDGRSTTREDSLARLARVVCADTTMLSDHVITQMATYIYEKQIVQVQEGLEEVASRLGRLINPPLSIQEIPVVVTGLGRKFLGLVAAKRSGVKRIMFMEDLYNNQIAHCSPAYGVALLASSQV